MSTVTQSKTCLLVVDVQKGFISDYTRKCLAPLYKLLDSKTFDVVIATRFYNPEDSLFRNQLGWFKFTNKEDIDLDEKVEKAADLVIDKGTYSAGKPLIDAIERYHVDEVMVVGIDTDVCVAVNAALLFDHGIPVSIDLKACASNGGPEADKSAGRMLERYIGAKNVLREGSLVA